jgi:hypothetical protein
VSLAICMIIFWGYWKGGHRKAQKTAVYYTMFALGFFIFSTIMWIVAAVMLHTSRSHGNGQDMWGWACNQNKRATLFQDTVNYALVCRLQNWTLICALIEIVVEVITISLYSVVAYRMWSKRKLHKSMNMRDKARSDLYLAQLKSQSAPNTPGIPKSAMSASFGAFPGDAAERGLSHFDPVQEAEAEADYESRHQSFSHPRSGFQLQPPPSLRLHEATPITDRGAFDANRAFDEHEAETIQDHMAAAPGEQQYASVPIPGAYADPMPSPGHH